MVSQQRILQMLDAKGWIAVYDRGTGDVDVLHVKPLVCWALVEDASSDSKTTTRVVGLDADAIANEHEPGKFLGYARESDSLGKFKKRARQTPSA